MSKVNITTTSAARQIRRQKMVAIARERSRRRQMKTNIVQLTLMYAFLICMTIFALFPIYFVIQASLGGTQNLFSTELRLVPANPTFDNYVYAFTKQPMWDWLLNTLFVCGSSTILGLLASMTGAYALSRFRFKGRMMTLNMLVVLQAFPGLLAITAYYYLLQNLGLLDSAPLVGLALIYVSTSIVFSCWNIKGYLDTIPVELEQAAMIDGANHWQAFWNITLPLAVPALTASGLLIFISGWSEFAIANVLLSANESGSNLTFILGLYRLQSDFRTPWGYFAATSVIISIPLVIFFLYAQRFFKSGLTLGGLKG